MDKSVTLNSGSVTANFDTKDVGTNKVVTIGGFTIMVLLHQTIQCTAYCNSNYYIEIPTITALDQTKCSGSAAILLVMNFEKISM